MAKVILIKANKGGIGKTWITLQLAQALQLMTNKKILILTSDSQNNILHFSGHGNVGFKNGLEDMINGNESEIITIRANLFFIPLKADYIRSSIKHKLPILINKLKKEYEYILIDSTPTLNLDKVFVDVADKIIIPTCLDEVTTNSLTVFMSQIDLRKIVAIIPNRFTRTKREKEYYLELVKALGDLTIFLTKPIQQTAKIGNLIDKGKTIWDSKSTKIEDIRNVFIDVVEEIINEQQ